jgi:hypothetical protein
MQDCAEVTLELSPDLVRAIALAARETGVRPSDLVAAALGRAFLAPAAGQGLRAGNLAADWLTGAILGAADWVGAQAALRRAGFVLRRAGEGGIDVHSWPEDRRLFPLTDAGLSPVDLALRFRAPFPGGGPLAALPGGARRVMRQVARAA